MGENKGHGEKSPSYPELDQMGSTASRAGQSAGNQQDIGRPQRLKLLQPGDDLLRRAEQRGGVLLDPVGQGPHHLREQP